MRIVLILGRQQYAGYKVGELHSFVYKYLKFIYFGYKKEDIHILTVLEQFPLKTLIFVIT